MAAALCFMSGSHMAMSRHGFAVASGSGVGDAFAKLASSLWPPAAPEPSLRFERKREGMRRVASVSTISG